MVDMVTNWSKNSRFTGKSYSAGNTTGKSWEASLRGPSVRLQAANTRAGQVTRRQSSPAEQLAAQTELKRAQREYANSLAALRGQMTAAEANAARRIQEQANRHARNLAASQAQARTLAEAAVNAAQKLANANARATNLARRATTSNANREAAQQELTKAQAAHKRALNAAQESLTAAQRNAAQKIQEQATAHTRELQTVRNAAKQLAANKAAATAALNQKTRNLVAANARANALARNKTASNTQRNAAQQALASAQAAHQQALANVQGRLNATQQKAAQNLQAQATAHQQAYAAAETVATKALNAATQKLAAANARANALARNKTASNTQRNAAQQALASAQAAHQQALANVQGRLNATQQKAAQNLQAQANAHRQAYAAAETVATKALGQVMGERNQARQQAANVAARMKAEMNAALRAESNRNVARAERNALQQELNRLRAGTGTPGAAVQAAQEAVNAATQTATNPNTSPENRNAARRMMNELQKIHNRLNKIPGKNQGSGMPPAIKIKFGNFRSGNVTQQTRTGGGGGGNGGPPPGPAPGAAGGSGAGPLPPPPNSNANAERKKKLNLARRGRNLMYILVDQYESGKLTRNQLLRRFTPQNRNRMSNALQNEPNALNAKYKNYLARMENIHKGDISEVSSKLNYKRVQNLLRNIQTQNGRNKGPARAALRTLRAQTQRWITMKRNMKYNQDPEVKRTINRVETEIKGSFGRGVNKFGRAVVQSLTPNERLTIQQRINKLKKNYTLAATQNQRNTIRQEMNQLKTSLEVIKNKKNVSTSSRGNFNGNFNKASGEAERVDRIRALTQLLKKYPEQRTKIQAEITRTIRKMYRDPPYGTKNTNIRYNLEDVKRLVGGRSANINRELAQGLQRFVSKKSTNSSSNMLRLAPRFEPAAGAAPRLFEQGAPPPSMMMPAAGRGAEAPGISVRVNAAPREVVQAATRALPPMERFALENVGGVKKAANIINNAGGPLVIQKAARILQKNKGNVVRAMKTTGLSRRVFTNVEKLGGSKKVTRVIRATKKVAKKTTTVGAKAKKKSIATIPGKTKKKVLSTRSKKLKKVTITEKRLKTLIAQIPKKNLEKNVFKCALP